MSSPFPLLLRHTARPPDPAVVHELELLVGLVGYEEIIDIADTSLSPLSPESIAQCSERLKIKQETISGLVTRLHQVLAACSELGLLAPSIAEDLKVMGVSHENATAITSRVKTYIFKYIIHDFHTHNHKFIN
jgi:hypothetical protein